MACSGGYLLVFCILTLMTTTADFTSTCTFTMQKDGLHADCSRRELTSVPVTWPDDVVYLDLSYNQLFVLTDELSHHHLAPLRHLDLSHNQLRDTLANHTFASLQHLRWLNLCHNHLQKIGTGAMTGLGQLTFLDMSNNQLRLQHHTFPPTVFRPLISLQELRLHGNDELSEGQYPDDLFTSLSNLHTLSVNSFLHTEFKSGFSALRKLQVLQLFDSNIHTLTNTTFSAFHNSSLEQILMTNVHLLEKIETCAFCHLPHLTHLTISSAQHVALNTALESLYGLQYQPVDTIDFSDMQLHLPTSSLNRRNTRYLRNICLSRLIVTNSNIEWVDASAFATPNSLFNGCLQYVDASENRIRGDHRTLNVFMNFFPNLTICRLEKQQVHSVFASQEGEDTSPEEMSFGIKIGTYVNISPKLEHVFASGGFHMLALPNFTSATNLQTLDVSYCRMTNCKTTISGLPALQTLDVSGSYCFEIRESFFDFCTSLRHLRMSNFNVNPEWFRTQAWRLFQKLELLETLDLSLNNLIHLDRHMLRAQRHLKELNLSGNRLLSMSVAVEMHENLQLLDLSHNMLPTLLPHERQELDTLAARHKFSLRLSANPLLCACSNLDFVQWLWSTHVQLDGGGSSARNFTCVMETSEVSDTASVKANYHVHWRRCHGQRLFGVAAAAFLLQLLVLVIVYVVSRSWTHIRYVWKVMKRLRLPRREHFRWDAYVGYAHADRALICLRLTECLEELRGLRLLVRDRDELLGCDRAENIVKHIDHSWRVLLMVTREFAMDEWVSGFTVLQAQRCITDTMPDRVIVVFLEDPARLPPMASFERLLSMVPESHVLHVHMDTSPAHPVWDRMAKLIVGEEHHR